ncbi:glycosyltransferase family 2 protein [Limibacter armeniacum]|uniref:glycosyltransferase family 2 protein n=1 Tax=Limibacter armeniacum TaxID=466084 RepID=UPI002FE62DEB
MQKLTAIIPTGNEEHNIEAVLESVSFADEVIVVDSYSTDRTVELASKHTNCILMREFDYPSSQKNWAIPQASNEWILLVDADERITPELKAEIQGILASDPKEDGFWIYRQNHFMGQEVNYSGWQNDKVVRLFRKSTCRYEDKRVHEEIEVKDRKIGELKHKMLHYTYVSLDHYISKLNQYAKWQAVDYQNKVHKVNFSHLMLKPTFRFFKHFFIQKGYRDGVVGFIISYLQSYAVASRYIRLWLLQQEGK